MIRIFSLWSSSDDDDHPFILLYFYPYPSIMGKLGKCVGFDLIQSRGHPGSASSFHLSRVEEDGSIATTTRSPDLRRLEIFCQVRGSSTLDACYTIQKSTMPPP